MSLISCIHYAIDIHYLLKTNCYPIKRISVGLIEDCCDYFVVSGSGFHIRQRAKKMHTSHPTLILLVVLFSTVNSYGTGITVGSADLEESMFNTKYKF